VIVLPAHNAGGQDSHSYWTDHAGSSTKGAGQFAAWFWTEINTRSTELIDELTTKGMELMLWYEENAGIPDWMERGEPSPPGWDAILDRAQRRKARYEHGTRGFRVFAADADGVIVLEKNDGWTPLPR
jgi:hypothetical protein